MPTGSLGKTVLKLHRGTNLDVCLSKQHLLETTIVGHWKSGGGKLHCRIQKMTSFCHLAPSHMKRWMHARGYRAIHSAYIHQHYYTERAPLFVRKKTELGEKATAYVSFSFFCYCLRMSKRKLPKSSCSYQITTKVQRAVRRCREHENEIENKKRTTEILNLWRTTGILMKFMVYN